MKKLASTLPNMILSLGLITVLAGAALGGMYGLTKDKIAAQEVQQRLDAIRQVAPPFTNDPVADADTVKINDLPFVVYPAFEDGRFNGAAVEGVTISGFSGEIIVMAGFDAKGDVVDYRVLRHAETPGLGSKMEEWFRDPTGARSVIGKNPSVTNFTVRKDGGDIDGITAATYSSRAFLEALRNAYEAYRGIAAKNGAELGDTGVSDATSGASKQHDASSGKSGDKKKVFKKGRENRQERGLHKRGLHNGGKEGEKK